MSTHFKNVPRMLEYTPCEGMYLGPRGPQVGVEKIQCLDPRITRRLGIIDCSGIVVKPVAGPFIYVNSEGHTGIHHVIGQLADSSGLTPIRF